VDKHIFNSSLPGISRNNYCQDLIMSDKSICPEQVSTVEAGIAVLSSQLSVYFC